jgi:hypothetical protein
MQKEIETKVEKRTQRSTSRKLFNGAHRGARALVEIQIFDSFILFFCIFSDFEFGQSKFSEPRLTRGKMDVEFFSTQLQIFSQF